MATKATTESGVQILSVDGDLVAATAGQFRGTADALLQRDERDYVVDFAKTTQVDSAGLEALTWLVRSSEERLGSVVACNLSDTMKTILHVTRLDKQLSTSESVQDAVASFG